MNRNIPLIVLALLVVAACNRPLHVRLTPVPAGSGTLEGTLSSGGVTRHYLLHVPASYQGNSSVPLIINFHGYNSNASQEENLTGMSAKADQEGFLVVYPDGLNGQWNTGPGTDGKADQQFIRDLLTTLQSQYPIDPKRIYATGISNGGGMANRLGCDIADVIAAIAPDSGAYNFWQDCSPSRPMPVLAFHGLDDNLIPYAGGTPKRMVPPIEEWAANWAKINGCSASSQTTTPVATVTIHTWVGCLHNGDVILYTLANHGHSWPGSPVMPAPITSQAVNATDLIWDFFKVHPMP